MEIYGNHGAKYFQISNATAAIISGRVKLAVAALEETKTRIEHNYKCDLRVIIKAAKGAFRFIIPDSKRPNKIPDSKRPNKDFNVVCLIGTVTAHGEAFIIKLHAAANFTPEFPLGHESIGIPQSRQAFEAEFPKLR